MPNKQTNIQILGLKASPITAHRLPATAPLHYCFTILRLPRFSVLLFFIPTALVFITGCGKTEPKAKANERVLHTTPGGKLNTLDPALSAALVSSYMIGAVYDTLLQYNYLKRPYVLEPSMLKSMPESDEKMMKYHFTLRDDLYFQPDKCFGINPDGTPKKRGITSKDVEFSFRRIADERLHSPGYWLFRNKIKGRFAAGNY